MPKPNNSTKIKPITTISTKKHEITTPLRRSQRLVHKSPQDLHTETPKPAANRAKNTSKKLTESEKKLTICGIPAPGFRRSPRFSNRVEENSSVRRSSRLSLLDTSSVKPKKNVDSSSVKCKDNSKGVRKCDEFVQKGEKKTRDCVNCSTVIGLEAVKRRDFCGKSQEIRVTKKRKRGEKCDKNNASVKDWTNEQEIALQRAYIIAKPTPNFWNQVSKMVPGKSAKDCFDRIHSDHSTPPQLLPRSRAKRMNSSPLGRFSLSAENFLSPSRLKVKSLHRNKLKSHMAHKTVRKLLQKHNCADQNYNGDLFSILEPNVSLPSQDLQLNNFNSTPTCVQEKRGFLRKCNERSSSGKKKQDFTFSPPVLKPVKNSMLHEKYIDQLHVREAKRKKACTRAGKENRGRINIPKTDVVSAAKNALVSDARDAISKLQHLQNVSNDEFSDIDADNCVDSDGDDDVWIA
ncbi:uncharacterized protein LOC126654553 [Mercurialis annua]|uniref:uncharacterized protein LOC126654553 n=1 Tax=Mercurialis annua TaxID=3986 RepID=UPI00215E1615|nr:uncharacterized protein LOC126654553 [Mercurialis annua]